MITLTSMMQILKEYKMVFVTLVIGFLVKFTLNKIKEAIIEIISKQQAKLIITVDNGISNLAEIKLAKSFHILIIYLIWVIQNIKCIEKITKCDTWII